MNPIHISSLTTLAVAVLLVALSLPLIYRRVPMNHWYGVRFKASFKSDKHWYEINAYGGKALCVAALPIAAWGVFGFFVSDGDADGYVWLDTAVVLASVLVAACLSWLKARRVDSGD